VFGVFVLNGFISANWIARIPAIQDHIGLGEGGLGLALLGAAAGSLIAMPLAGWGVPKVGSKVLTIGTLAALAVTLPLLAVANSGWMLFLVLAVFGASFGSCDVTMNAQAVEVEHGYGRPILVSFHAGFSFGGLGGALAGGLAATLDIDPLPHFIAIGVLGLVALAFLAPPLLPFKPQTAVKSDEPQERLPLMRFIRRLPNRLLILGVIAFCCLIGEGAMADWTAVYLDDWLDTSSGLAAGGYAAFSLTMAVGRLFGDRLTAAWGPVAILRRGGTMVAIGLGAALILGAPWAAIVGCACVGAGLAATFPVVLSAAGKTPGLGVGPALAVATTCGYFGFLVGPPLIGLTAEIVGLPTSLGIVAIMGVVIAALAGAAREPEVERAP
jgi:MFS family permease